MSVRDMALNQRAATRFSVVKRAAESFVAARTGDKIGLILFGQNAYLLTPLTYDHHAVLDRLADASVGLAGQTTSIGDALGLAVKRLQQVPPDGRVIILLTDGVNNSGVLAPQKAAELAQLDGIKVYTIGLGAESNPQAFGGMFINATQTAELDEETLKTVADMTGGRYFRATDMASLQSIYALINRMELATQEQTRARPEIPYYVWPLGMALGLLFYWFVRRLGVRFYA
jgi:Ca-activated chloride channel family protein